MEGKKFFGRFVRAKRLEAKLTLEQAAELCDMSVRGYADVEVGKSDPKWSTVVKITEALQLDLNNLIAEFKKSTPCLSIDGKSVITHLFLCFIVVLYRSPCAAWLFLRNLA